MPIEIQDEQPEDNSSPQSKLFGKTEEQAIISLIFDQPEFMTAIMPYMEADYFDTDAVRYAFSLIKFHQDKNGVILSRAMCLDIAEKELTADDPIDEILAVIKRESDPREVPVITDKLVEWAKKKAYGKLYNKDAIDAHDRGDYDKLEQILDEARRITDSQSKFSFFFKEFPSLFVEEKEDKLTTGFPRLDEYLNMGGPTRGDVVCFMAPTGVGKSIILNNCGASNIKRGLNILHVTLEMPTNKVELRYMGCFSEIWIRNRFKPDNQDKITKRLQMIKQTYGGELIVVEYPPDDISVDVIHANIDVLRRLYGVRVDVVIVDYLECLMSRHKAYNDKDYIRQKHISTELTRLAKKENVLVFTATQTNRGGNDNLKAAKDDNVIELNKVAESYGKLMPVDYLITINQTKQEYDDGKESADENAFNTNARCRLYVAKNRNGPKFMTVSASINYETMSMKEVSDK